MQSSSLELLRCSLFSLISSAKFAIKIHPTMALLRRATTKRSVIWWPMCCPTISICQIKMKWDEWRLTVLPNRLIRGLMRKLLFMANTTRTIIGLARRYSKNSLNARKNSHKVPTSTQVHIKVPTYSHWAADIFRSPFFVCNFAE